MLLPQHKKPLPVQQASKLVELGHVTGAHGLQGWLKVYSDTQPRENIATYNTLLLGQKAAWQAWKVSSGKRQGRYVILKLNDCNDRDQAESLIGAQIAIQRDQLPQVEESAGEYYWADLIGLEVKNSAGDLFGVVDHLFATGANDVIVVRGEQNHLIPYIWHQVIKAIDLKAGYMLVDWDKDF